MTFQIKRKAEGRTEAKNILSCVSGTAVYSAFREIQHALGAEKLSDVCLAALSEFLEGSVQLLLAKNMDGTPNPLCYAFVQAGKERKACEHKVSRLSDLDDIIQAAEHRIEDLSEALALLKGLKKKSK